MNTTFKGIGMFLLIGAGCALYAGITLLWPGTVLDVGWVLNPAGHAGLRALGRGIGLPFCCLAGTLAVVGRGWLKQEPFAWYGAITILGVNLVGDIVRGLAGQWREGLVGVVAAGLLLTYIVSPRTKQRFHFQVKE